MPIRINEILANNEQEANILGDDVLKLVEEDAGTLSGVYEDKNSKMQMQSYDLCFCHSVNSCVPSLS